MRYIGTTSKGYPVYEYTWIEFQKLKDMPKAGVILAKSKSEKK